MNKKYNIGLDIGTTSVGWAVVEADTQKIIRKGRGKNKKTGEKGNRKALWGVRLFDEASTAEGRRGFRSSRRRYDRRRNRIYLLQKEFANEINNVDKDFFKKLEESKYCEDDKVNKSIIISADEKKKAKEYNDKYKTIYHLRNRLINDSSKEDIRLVYLALHHIIKYRGNFLYSGEGFNASNLDLVGSLKNCFDLFVNLVPVLNISEDYAELIDLEELSSQIMNPSKNDAKTNVKNILSDLSENNKFATEFSKLVIGNKFSIKDLFQLENIDKKEDVSINFSEADMDDDEKVAKIEALLGDQIEVINSLKELYDVIFLKKLFKGSSNTSLSSLMVERYNIHKKDLSLLKSIFKADRDYKNKINEKNPKNNELYNKVFKTKSNSKEMCLYDSYIHNKISYEDFKRNLEKYLEAALDNVTNEKILEEYAEAKFRISNGDFLPRITDPDNGRYPYQLNKDELIKIIENQGQYYPFLMDKINNEYKIVKLLKFRIPYYVGPLVSEDRSPFAWMERKVENVRITPYNFDEVIDKEKTAEKFIKRMISHCTYLLNEYALPNNSILYSRYKVMNELKQIKVNGNKLSIDVQHKIIKDFFEKTNGSITDKKFKEYLYSLNELDMYEGDINVTGYSSDGKFANNMQSYIDFFGSEGIFNGTSYNEEDADEIIEWITIFDDKDILKKKVEDKYLELSDAQVKKVLSRKYSGWGKLSRKLLTELTIKDKVSGIPKSVMTLMYETEENFMQIINNDEYKFQDLIRDNNVIEDNKKISYDLVKELATSPATKKGIYQALKVVEEIVDYMGYDPKNIMVEMARSEDIKKERKDDRKKYLLNLYSKIKEDNEYLGFTNYDAVYSQLNNKEKIDTQKLFLYFIQEGKCLYSGKPLNIEDLDSYEVDHILPRTLIKDDSIDNKALVYRECNQKKAANFVLPAEYRKDYMKKWWAHLKKVGLISAKKFYHLTRESYSDEDIQGFINRQLVETRQITKHVANILSNFYKDTKIVYLKANLSHNYREKYELFKFREINDFHHAHDAYLAAVLGEYKEKYMKKNINFEMVKEMNSKLKDLGNYKQLKYGFVINSLDENVNDVVVEVSKKLVDEETGELLFDAKEFNKRVENTLYRNDILVSRKTEIRKGQLFKQTIYSKEIGNIPLKKNMPTNLYGGYLNIETSYLVLVEYNKKRKIIGIPMEIALKSKKNKEIKYNFIKEHLTTINEINVIKDYIPYESLINYKGQNVYIKGYGVANKVCEVSNALQLKIPVDKAKEWKYVLNKVFNKKYILEIDDCVLNVMKEIITYLYQQKVNYPLFASEISKIKNKIDLDEMNFEELSKIIIELLKIYHCNSVNGNLKEFGLGDRIGRLSGKNIDSGIYISKSVTGIKESKYEF